MHISSRDTRISALMHHTRPKSVIFVYKFSGLNQYNIYNHMLQFITRRSDRWTTAEQAAKAIEGGCRWIQLSAESLPTETPHRREAVEGLIPICKENEAFLIIEDDVDLVDLLKVHGVCLRDNSRSAAMQAREQLGAEAVIGVEATSAAEIIALKGLDIDYIMVKAPADVTTAEAITAFYSGMLQMLEQQGIDVHIVAEGDYPVEVLTGLLSSGCAGVAVSALIADSENPASATATLLDALDKARKKAEDD